MKKRRIMVPITDDKTGYILAKDDEILVSQVVQELDGNIYVVVYNDANLVFHLNIKVYLHFTTAII